MSKRYRQPPTLEDKNGLPRRAGFEFEFGNLPIIEAARALKDALGGELDIISPFEAVLHDSQLGRLKVERDADVLKSMRYRKLLSHLGIEFAPGSLAHDIETNIDSATRNLIPCEVVTDPIPFGDLDRLDLLVSTLNALGAEGTQHSIIYAFGLHINPSLPAEDSATVLRYIQAFLLLHAWIVELAQIDLTRRFLTPYIDPFPLEYMEQVLDNSYTPGMPGLIDDYMAHNPTRNRALDMLPILCHLDETRVLEKLPKEEQKLVKGRPAFHYRLPDCKVNVPGWSVAAPWNRWVFVETLAEDQALLSELIEEWRLYSARFTLAPNSRWIIRLTTILSQKFFQA